jgi:hypothetical protein
MSNILPVSNVINVTIEPTPSGLTEKNVNSLALFTNESPGNLDQYGVYISAGQVAADYGSDSVTAAMANAVFSQVPNVLSGGGRLVIIPLIDAVSAIAGKIVTANVSANLATLIGVADGDLKVTINGVANNLTGLNFTNCTTLVDVATVLQAALPDCIVTATTTQITFTSKKVGSATSVALAAYSGGGTNLTGAGYLNTGSAVATGGSNSSGETILEAITRTSGLVGYVPLMTNLDLEDAAIEAIAAGVQALDNMFFHHCASTADIAGVCTTISQATETRTRMLLYTPSQAAANLMKAAYAGRACSVDFTGSNTSATMNLKALATITPDPGITQTLYAAANVAGVDIYVSYDGVPSVYSTVGNTFFDNPYSDLALKFALEAAGFNYLRQTNTKVPQTEPGMNGLKAAYANICQQFVRNGCMAPGSWTSSETFGDPQIFVNNILTQGFYIYSLPVAQQNATDRDARIAPLVQIAIKRAGAIQTGNVIVIVND